MRLLARTAPLAIAVTLALLPKPAHAGLTLAWDDCIEGIGRTTEVFGCASNSIELGLFPTFSLAQPLDSVVAVEGVIDLISASDPLPDWWRMDPSGCRPTGLYADVTFAGGGCGDPWNGNGIAQIQAYRVSPQEPSTNRARIVFTASVPAAQMVTVAGGTPYYGARVVLRTIQSAGPGTVCAGCATQACLVFNSIQLLRRPGTVGAGVTVTDPGSTANWAFWESASGVNCMLVPTRNRTWGALKSLYR